MSDHQIGTGQAPKIAIVGAGALGGYVGG